MKAVTLPFYSHPSQFSPSLDTVSNSSAHPLSPGLCDLRNKEENLFPILGSLPGLVLAIGSLTEKLVSALLSEVRAEAIQSAYHCLTGKPHSSIQVTSSLSPPLSLRRAPASALLLQCLLLLLGDVVWGLRSGESFTEHLL